MLNHGIGFAFAGHIVSIRTISAHTKYSFQVACHPSVGQRIRANHLIREFSK
jgi:hypothetical protein